MYRGMRIFYTCAVLVSISPFAVHGIETPTGQESEYKHWIADKGENGTVIVLEDGSVWAVDAVDQVKVSVWLQVDKVMIVKSPSTPLYPYLMLDKEHDDDRVHVKYLGHS